MPFTLKTSRRIWRTSARSSTARPDLEFRAATKALELERSALSYQRVPPGYRFPYGHTHSKQEEVYVVVRGSGRMKLDDEIVELVEWDAVRVPPGTWRGYEAGPEGWSLSSSARRTSARIRAETWTAGATGGRTRSSVKAVPEGPGQLVLRESKIVISTCCSSTGGIATRSGWPRSPRRIPITERASTNGGRG